MKKGVSERKLERFLESRRRADMERGLTLLQRAENEVKRLLAHYDPHNDNRIKYLLDVLRTKGGYYDGRFAKYRDQFRKVALDYQKNLRPY